MVRWIFRLRDVPDLQITQRETEGIAAQK
jgi:hypothetical protein